MTYNATFTSATRSSGISGWDQYGNLTQQTVVKSDDDANALFSQQRITTVNAYDASTATAATPWIDKLQSSIVTQGVIYTPSHATPNSVSPNVASVRTVYAWNCDRSLAWKGTFDARSGTTYTSQTGCNTGASVNGGVYATTTYAYPSPSYGLPSSSTVNASFAVPASPPSGMTTTFAPRTTILGYSSDGYFVISVLNPLNQQTTSHVRQEDGQTDSVTDPNALSVYTQFDQFGHTTQITYGNADGTQREPSVNVAWTSCSTNPSACSAAGDSQANYIVTSVKDGAPTQVAAFDVLGRPIDKATRGFNGTFVHETTAYDGMGSVASTTAPYYQGAANYATTFKYDALDRVMTKVAPTSELNSTQGNTQTTYTYAGETTTIAVKALGTNACTVANLCFTMTRIGSAIGKYMQTTEPDPNSAADGNTSGKVVTNYWYDGGGNPVGIQDGKGNTTAANYNAFGQRTQSVDPNQGTWTFLYDGLGELVQQIDARGALVTVISRDPLGRVLTQTATPPTAGAPTGMTNEATQDAWVYDTSVIGAPTSITRQRGASLSALSNVWSESYTYDSNTKRLTQRSVTQEKESSALITQYQYDAYYGREKTITYPSGFSVWHQYNAYGMPSTLLDGTILSPNWTLAQADAYGHAVGEKFGNGIIGTHSYSASTGQAKQLNWKNSAGTTVDGVTYQYDSLGNLWKQTRNGTTETYGYDALQRLTGTTRSPQGNAVNYQYDAVGNLMAKSDYSLPGYGSYAYGGAHPNGVTTVNLAVGGTATYGYDANGNVISGTVSESYDANNQARTITRGNTATFFYGPTGARYREEAPSRFNIFGADGYERDATVHRHELGPVVYSGPKGQIAATYMLRDRLGSVISETDKYGAIVNNGSTPAQRGYDAFGRVRNGDLSDNTYGQLVLGPVTYRGFTGQEHQDDTQVIHMNGRIYDYNLGRFLGVDPIIGNPLHSQSLNPYSYIGNNPLSGTDPSGYYAHCNGDKACQDIDDAQFLGGPAGTLWHSLSFPGNGAARQTVASHNSSVSTSDIGSTREPLDNCSSGPLTCHKITPDASNPSDRDQSVSSHEVNGAGYINGVTGDEARHAALAEPHLAAEFKPMPSSYILIDSPSAGLVRDVVKIGLTQMGINTAAVKQLARILLDVQHDGHHLDLVCHSGGCAELKAAARILASMSESMTNIRVCFHAGANNMLLTNTVLDHAGIARFGGINAPGYRYNPHDAVPQVVGGNALLHPVDMLMSIWNVPKLFSGDEHLSPHTLPYRPDERLP
jgi:RHS repeat-associated protein